MGVAGSDLWSCRHPAHDLHVLDLMGHLILVPARAAAEVWPQLLGRRLGGAGASVSTRV